MSRTSRRAFLKLAATSGGLTLLALACTPALLAPPGATSGVTALQLPTYVAFSGPSPDLPGSSDGLLPPGYLNYPRNTIRSVQQPVGGGEEVTAVTYTTQAPPTPAEQNPAWQRVNQELGLDVKLPLTQLADYPTKLNTVIASGALPDLLSLGAGNGPASPI
jgi:putative aldouronate transport system substrate-binding protein